MISNVNLIFSSYVTKLFSLPLENTTPKHASSNANGIAPTNGGISPQDSEKLRGILGKMSSSLFEKGVRFAADKSVAPICSDCYKSIDR